MDWRGEFYQHDPKLPLDAEEKLIKEEEWRVRFHVEFTSMHEHRVPAHLTLPTRVPRPPIVLILHGVTGSKESRYVKGISSLLVRSGYATMALDSQYHGDRSRADRDMRMHNFTSYTNRNASVQTALDGMRAIDYLESRDDLDTERVGFVGFSQGTIVGTPFCAHDERVRAVALIVGGGNFLRMYGPGPNTRSRDRAERIFETIDPVHHVGFISPRPLLMVNATRDELIPRECTEDLFAAAREPKRIVWYESGHRTLPKEAFHEVTAFMDAEIGTPAIKRTERSG